MERVSNDPASGLDQHMRIRILEPCKNDASEREERKSPNPGKRSAKRSVRVYAANCDCVTCLSKCCRFGCGTAPATDQHFQFLGSTVPLGKGVLLDY